MADKETLISSIKKLLSLSVSDDEILSNLSEVGIDKTEAKILLREAKQPFLEKKSEQKTAETKTEPKKEIKLEEEKAKQEIKEEIKEIKKEVKE